MRWREPVPVIRRAAPAVLATLSALALAACAMVAGTPFSFGDSTPVHPADAALKDPDALEIWARAMDAKNLRILVSIEKRRLWLLDGKDTVMSAPVAVGKGQTFTYKGKTYRFETPRGQRRVIGKETNPRWVPPEWHYYEKAARRKLEVVHLEKGQRVRLSDGTYIEVRDEDVGRINQFGNFWPFTPGMEIIFDGKIFIPPLGTRQRSVPDALGTHKLDLGDGYLIHGTHVYNEDSIGRAVSHGCIRMRNQDVAKLYDLVPVGTPVYIY